MERLVPRCEHLAVLAAVGRSEIPHDERWRGQTSESLSGFILERFRPADRVLLSVSQRPHVSVTTLPGFRYSLRDELPLGTRAEAAHPLLHLQLTAAAGSSSDPDHARGLSGLPARLLKQGSEHWSAEQLTDACSEHGLDIIVSPGLDTITLSAEALSEHQILPPTSCSICFPVRSSRRGASGPCATAC